jgi:hypothetical protein
VEHTIAVTDVLIGAQLLSQTVPGIVLHRMYTERELKRKIYVQGPETLTENTRGNRTICLEPDASVHFLLQGKWHNFFHFEVYRTHLSERRFKHKITGYAMYAGSLLHRELFHTPALAIAVIAQPVGLAARLKQWTEEVLHAREQPELGEQFFFVSVDPATASPEEMFLSPVWEQAFATTKTPLLVLE